MKNINQRKGPRYPSSRSLGNRWLIYIKKLLRSQLLLSIVGGIMVGSFFGFLTLQFLKGEGALEVIDEQDKVNATKAPEENLVRLLDASSSETFYVVQVGLFSKATNAESHQSALKKEGIDSFIWEREGEYFLLYGTFFSESDAKKEALQLEEKSIPAYVKAWKLELDNLQVTEGEKEWLENVYQLGIESLQKEQAIDPALWHQLHQQEPPSQRVESISRAIEPIVQKGEKLSPKGSQWLAILYTFENHLKNG